MSPATRAFSLTRAVLGDRSAAHLEIHSPEVSALIDALTNPRGSIPPGEIPLGAISAKVDGGSEVTFASGQVAFSGHAGAAFGMGVYVDAAHAIKAIAPAQELAEGLNLSDPESTRYLVLRAAFDAAATARGSIALAPGAGASFGVEGSTRRLFAILHRFHDTDTAADVFAATFDSWTLPRDIDRADALAPGTWVLAEVDGTLAMQLSAHAGYDFSWLHQIPQGALRGDIGLRVHLGVTAAFGFEASGKYLLVVGREATTADGPDAHDIRVRLHKLSKKGWTFALDARVAAQSALPAFFDRDHRPEELVAAIFGLNESQVIGALGEVREFVNPGVSLQDRLAGLVMHLGGKAIDEAAGLNAGELRTIYETGRRRLVQFVERFDRLLTTGGHEITSVLLSLTKVDIAELTTALQDIASAGGEQLAQDVIKRLVTRVGFERTPIGRVIEAAAGSALAAVNDREQAMKIRGLAAEILAVLEGETLQQALDFIRSRVHVGLLKRTLDRASFDALDNLLKDRIASFLGRQPNLDDLDEVRTAINAVLEKGDALYAAALAAVKKQQEFAFASRYARTTEKAALIDATFDLSKPGVAEALSRMLAGDMGGLLVTEMDGVKLAVGSLSHGIARNVSAELTLPFGRTSTVVSALSTATLNVVEDNGRVLLYALDARSSVEERTSLFRARHGRNSALTVAASIPVRAGAVRVWNPQVFKYTFRMERAVRKMRVPQLIEECQPLVERYVPSAFGSAGSRTFGEWAADLDKSLDGKDPHSGTHDIGDTLIALTLTAPPAYLAAWAQAPADRRDVRYKVLSLSLQRRLKELVTFYLFSDPAKYGSLRAAAPAIVFSSMRPTTNVDLDGISGTVTFDAGSELYWDHRSLKEVRAVIHAPDTLAALAQRMRSIAATLRGIPGLADTAQFYEADQRARIIDAALDVLHAGSPVPELLGSLLSLEAQLVDSAVRSALEIAAFRMAAGSDPEEALSRLAEFGERLSRTFNETIGSHPLLAGAARPLASVLFMEASTAFDPGLVSRRLAAVMEISVVKSGRVTIEQMLAGEITNELILHSQRFVEV